MKRYKPYVGRNTTDTLVMIIASLAIIGIIAAAYIALSHPIEYTMQPVEDADWYWDEITPQPVPEVSGAKFTLSIEDANSRIKRHNEDVVASWEEFHASDLHIEESEEPEEPELIEPPEGDVYILAQMLSGECYEGEIVDKTRASWVVINRVESPVWPDTIVGVISQAGQFFGWHANTTPSEESLTVARKVLTDWINDDYSSRHETCGDEIYIFFSGNGSRVNDFRAGY